MNPIKIYRKKTNLLHSFPQRLIVQNRVLTINAVVQNNIPIQQ